jgi:hypothetical protein
MTPLTLLIVKPVGRPVADHVRVPVPPVALTGAAYGCPTVQLGSVNVDTFKAALIVNVYERLFAVAPTRSVALIVTVNEPVAVGVPEITPAVLSVSPVGSAPADTDQVTEPVPPLDDIVIGEYANPAVQFGNDGGPVTDNAGLMKTVPDNDAVAPTESVTVTVYG